MTEHELESAIATIIHNYRKDELQTPLDANHVRKWVSQFDESSRRAILSETFNILSKYYFTDEDINGFLQKVITYIDKVEPDYRHHYYVDIQEQGSSQRILYRKIAYMYAMMHHNYPIVHTFFKDEIQASLSDPSAVYIYIDDGLYTGGRARTDIRNLIDILPENSRLYVFYMIAYSNGLRYAGKVCTNYANMKNISVDFVVWKSLMNDRNQCDAEVDFLWPHKYLFSDTLDTIRYVDNVSKTMNPHYVFNPYDSECALFKSQADGDVLMKAFTEAGVRISNRISDIWFQPLGRNNVSNLGFGAFVATDYNIPNNSPLVLWWGSLVPKSGPLGIWYPLLPRRDNFHTYIEAYKSHRQYNLKNYTEILKTVRLFALDRERKTDAEDRYTLSSFADIDLSRIQAERNEDQLLNYLHKQTMDAIKIIQTVMYIGRDFADQYDTQQEISIPVANPDALVVGWMRDLKAGTGWKSKTVEIEMIYEKASLGTYLSKAFEILGIK